MVDASIGGKTAINSLKFGKNLIGTIFQPKLIILNLWMLHEIPAYLISDGMSEVIKVFAMFDQNLFNILKSHNVNTLRSIHNRKLFHKIVKKAIQYKINIIELDESDKGIRNVLNFGHTIGHAIESLEALNLSHGKSVSIGLVTEMEIASYLNLTADNTVREVREVLENFSLPTEIPMYIDPYDMIEKMKNDKKTSNSKLKIVVIKNIGELSEGKTISLDVEFVKNYLCRSVHVDKIKNDKNNNFFQKSIRLKGSKSICNRALILSALSKGEIFLKNFLFSEDTLVMIKCLKNLGVEIEILKNKISENIPESIVKVTGHQGKFENIKTTLQVENAGTAARFLVGVCTICKNSEIIIDGNSRMRERPIEDLLESITSSDDIEIIFLEEPNRIPFKIITKDIFKGGELNVKSKKSSQYVTSLLLSAPLFSSDETVINLVDVLPGEKPVSYQYIDMTIDMMRLWGVDIKVENANRYIIKRKKLGNFEKNENFILNVSNQFLCDYINPEEYFIEPDASTANFYFSFIALHGGEITLEGIGSKSIQGDSKFVEFLKKIDSDNKNRFIIEQGENYTKLIHNKNSIENSENSQISSKNQEKSQISQNYTKNTENLKNSENSLKNAEKLEISQNSTKNSKNPEILKNSQISQNIIFDEDLSLITDSFLALGVICSQIPGEYTFRGLSNQAIKESNRLELLALNLNKLGVFCSVLSNGDGVYINSHLTRSNNIPFILINCANDHRIAMSFAILGSYLENTKLIIDNKNCVNKTYPEFWKDFNSYFSLETSVDLFDTNKSIFKLYKENYRNSPVFLIGMRSCGKSLFGKFAAEELDLNFIDFDLLLLERNKEFENIEEIVSKHGWDYFRKLERNLFFEIFVNENYMYNSSVIACGGGIVENLEILQCLKSYELVVFIDTNLENIKSLINKKNEKNQKNENRPNFVKNFDEVYHQRVPRYNYCSKFTFKTPVLSDHLIHDENLFTETKLKLCRIFSNFLYSTCNPMKYPLPQDPSFFLSILLTETNQDEILENLTKLSQVDTNAYSAIEFRADGLINDFLKKNLKKEEIVEKLALIISKIRFNFSICVPIIFTIRSINERGFFNIDFDLKNKFSFYNYINTEMTRYGIEFFDIEFHYENIPFIEEFYKKSKSHGNFRIILSKHYLKEENSNSYSVNQLKKDIYTISLLNHDICKIITNTNPTSYQEIKTFINTYITKPLIHFQLGEENKLTRVMNTFLNPVYDDKIVSNPTGKGQMTIREINEVRKLTGMEKRFEDRVYYVLGNPVDISPSPFIYENGFDFYKNFEKNGKNENFGDFNQNLQKNQKNQKNEDFSVNLQKNDDIGENLQKKVKNENSYIFLRKNVNTQDHNQEFFSILNNTKLSFASITIPFKEIIPQKNQENFIISSEAKFINSVNTVKKHLSGTTFCCNSDWIATYELILQILPKIKKNLNSVKILILGAGGAAVATILPLLLINIDKNNIYIKNRTVEKIQKIIERFNIREYHTLTQYDIVISSIPKNCEINFLEEISKNISEKTFCVDLAYSKDQVNEPTNFRKITKMKSENYINGLDFLITQAYYSFEVFSGKIAPRKFLKEKLFLNFK
jgi:3-phosphoshikimate 1-carboxyvinyltransferase